MSYGACYNQNDGCKYYDSELGCRTNEHHIFKQQEAHKLGKTAVLFANLPRNRVQICQAQHEEIEARFGWPEFPPLEVMQAIIGADHEPKLRPQR